MGAVVQKVPEIITPESPHKKDVIDKGLGYLFFSAKLNFDWSYLLIRPRYSRNSFLGLFDSLFTLV